MKTKYLLILVFTFLIFNLSAQEVSLDEARQKAIDFFQVTDKTPTSLKSALVIKVDTFATYYTNNKNQLKSTGQSKEPAFYIFNRSDKKGFVIVSADKRIRDIIAYSNISSLSNTNPGLEALLNQYIREIAYAKENNINANTITYDYSLLVNEKEWLLKDIEWAQNPDPYNTLCPPHSSLPHCPTGCQATVLGQILYYYKYPRFGTGSHSYTSSFGLESALFSETEYKYELMKDVPSAPNIQVSTLLYHCGVSQDMKYTIDGSGAPTSALPIALRTYFGYKANNKKDKSWYLWSRWKEIIKNEIDNKRPVAYRGVNPEDNSAHIFIVDYYNNLDQYHINWGWGSDHGNAYYLLTTLPSYTNDHEMVTGIEPANPDNIPPKVTYLNCTVETNTDITITFNEPLDPNTLTNTSNASIIVNGEKSGNHEFIFNYNPDLKTLTINPILDFLPSEKVTVTLRSLISDLVGNGLDGDGNGTEGPNYTYQFTTTSYTHDYTVASLYISNINPVAVGDEVQVNAYILNNGTSTEPENQTIKIYDNDVLIESYSALPSLVKGEGRIFIYNWIAKAGTHDLKVEVLLTGDENSTNNNRSVKVPVNKTNNLPINGVNIQEINMSLFSASSGKYSLQLQNTGSGSSSLRLNNTSSGSSSMRSQKSGTDDIYAAVAASRDKESWVTLTGGDSLTILSGETKTYPIGLTVPSGTSPGTYTAGVLFTYADSTETSEIVLNITVMEPQTGLSSCEYWFDDQYSQKKVIDLNSQTTSELNTSLPTSGLEEGLHSFHIRYLDNSGYWSPVVSEFFYKESVTSGKKIVAYEYWFDDNYSSREYEKVRARDKISIFDDLDATSLREGLHSYHIRFRDNLGAWSSVASEFFCKLPILPDSTRKITNYEYWFDADYASRILAAVTPSETYSLQSGLNVASLPEGLHSFHVRYRDDAGQWSSVVSEFVLKLPVTANNPNLITAYRYWFDRNESTIPVTHLPVPANPYELIRNIDASALTEGDHTIHFQFKDSLQAWSSVVTDTFNLHIFPGQEISLSTGWNIYSGYLAPNDPDLKKLSQSLINDGSLVKTQDEKGNAMENLGSYGGWQNAIGNLYLTEGYKTKVFRDCLLEINGMIPDFPYKVPLTAGWNIVGYPRQSEADARVVMQPLINRGTLIKVQDEKGHSLEDLGPDYGGWTNNIGNFSPGEGYKVKVSQNDTLTINETYTKSAVILAETLTPVHFHSVTKGNGVDHMNINLVAIPEGLLEEGDEVGVFDGNLCVASMVIGESKIRNRTSEIRNLSIPVSASDGSGANGFTVGHPFTLKLWKASSGLEYTLKTKIIKGTSTFVKHETSLASIEESVITGLGGTVNTEARNIRIYPNPTDGKVYIFCFDNSLTGKQVQVINAVGQQVLNQFIGANPAVIDLSGRVSGVYYVQITGDFWSKTEKIMLR